MPKPAHKRVCEKMTSFAYTRLLKLRGSQLLALQCPFS